MSEYQSILNQLLSVPLRSQIKIDFDLKNKLYQLSVPIFSGRSGLPESVKQYVEARKNHRFKPHATAFQIQKVNGVEQVFIVQHLAFAAFAQPLLRQEVNHFWNLAKKCKKMISEIALEEQYRDALYLDSDLMD